MNKESTKEKIEIMQAWLDGETIQYSNLVGGWRTLTKEPVWNFETNEYRIKPKQKVKKTIKYLCFEDSNGNLFYAMDKSKGYNYMNNYSYTFTRIPEFDKTREIEVEE